MGEFNDLVYRSVRPPSTANHEYQGGVSQGSTQFIPDTQTTSPNAIAHKAQLRSALLQAGVQPRLEIGAVNDPLEREADAVAERILHMPKPQVTQKNLVQTKTSAAPTSEASSQLESRLNSLSGGTPLDTSSRAFFEPRFGQDFSQVRIHTNTFAAQMSNALNAKAFTLGNDIAFATNQYSAHTPAGKNLLGHELVHVVQQRGLNGSTPQAKLVQRNPLANSPIVNLDNPLDNHFIDNSPTLKKDVNELKAEGCKFVYVDNAKGGGGDHDTDIVKNGDSLILKDEVISIKTGRDPSDQVLTLAHEVGHAKGIRKFIDAEESTIPGNGHITKDEFFKIKFANEGDATLYRIHIQKELDNVFKNKKNSIYEYKFEENDDDKTKGYIGSYDKLIAKNSGKNWDEIMDTNEYEVAREETGNAFQKNEKIETGISYTDYYTKYYDEHYNKQSKSRQKKRK